MDPGKAHFQPKSRYFFLILHENICCRYPLEVHQWDTSDSFPASGDFSCLLISFANSLDPDQARQNVGPDFCCA